mmetsp:Transcript_2352/g.7732  ORF Transcript_2352/g.7732 Transcript_2352/m.7732 type:complete len:202 (+) Transcript_2352:199-804(+)
MRGIFSWNSAMRSLSVSATLSGAWGMPSSEKALIVLKLPFHIALTSASTTSGSTAFIEPCSHSKDDFWKSLTVFHSAWYGAIMAGTSVSCGNCDSGKPSSASSSFMPWPTSLASLIPAARLASAVALSATRLMSPSFSKACACATKSSHSSRKLSRLRASSSSTRLRSALSRLLHSSTFGFTLPGQAHVSPTSRSCSSSRW